MKTYEAVAIFKESLNEEEVEQGIEEIKKAVVNLNGVIDSAIHMGRKNFARKMKKQSAGEYVLIRYSLSPEKAGKEREALKHSTLLFRLNIVRADEALTVNQP